MSKIVRRWCPVCDKQNDFLKEGCYLRCRCGRYEMEEYEDTKNVLIGGKAIKIVHITNPGGG
mgnify:CR=1 FL=1